MERKLKLNLDDLRVETFVTGSTGLREGTIFGQVSQDTSCGPATTCGPSDAPGCDTYTCTDPSVCPTVTCAE